MAAWAECVNNQPALRAVDYTKTIRLVDYHNTWDRLWRSPYSLA